MSENALLIVGLGNPGERYAGNRHNAGFLVLEHLASSLQDISTGAERSAEKKWGSGVCRFRHLENGGPEMLLVRPMLFMNRSGGPVCGLLKSYGIPMSRMLVVHDEIELGFGEIRLKEGGGHKGHNGLRDIIDVCGSSDFSRLRFGVGRPDRGEIADYVLSNFTSEEQSRLPELFVKAEDSILNWSKGRLNA